MSRTLYHYADLTFRTKADVMRFARAKSRHRKAENIEEMDDALTEIRQLAGLALRAEDPDPQFDEELFTI